MKRYSIILFILCLQAAEAKIYKVGSSRTYKTPSQLENVILDGDTVEIDNEEYVGDVTLWKRNNLFIKGVAGRPHFRANGVRLRWNKSIWLIMGNNIIIENIEFSEAVISNSLGGNGAGIRTEPQATNITIRNCYFHHNQNGIFFPDNPKNNILIESCEFAYNGFGDTGFTHNMYINKVQSFTLRFCYSHHIDADGHLVKSRAAKSFILYNRIADEPGGNSSRLIDLSNGGESYVIGNILIQNAQAINKNLISYGLEGYTNVKNELYIANNTMINERFNGTFIDVANGADKVQIMNNIMVGTGERIKGTAELFNNLNFDQVNQARFQDISNDNYRPTSGSPVVDNGLDFGDANGYSLTPQFEYQSPLSGIIRNRIRAIDIGAYEFIPECFGDSSLITKQFYTICKGDSIFLGGDFQSQSAIYRDTLFTQAGCDSVVISQLTVNPLPTRPSINFFTPNILCASTDADTYQWLLDGILLTEEVQCLRVEEEGIYRVLTVKNSCTSDTSEALNFTLTDLSSDTSTYFVKVFPNPSSGKINLNFVENSGKIKITLFDLLGHKLWSTSLALEMTKQALKFPNLESGTYILKIDASSQTYYEILIIGR